MSYIYQKRYQQPPSPDDRVVSIKIIADTDEAQSRVAALTAAVDALTEAAKRAGAALSALPVPAVGETVVGTVEGLSEFDTAAYHAPVVDQLKAILAAIRQTNESSRFR